MEKKLEKLFLKLSAIETELSQPEILNDQKRYRVLAAEHASLLELKEAWEELCRIQRESKEAKALLDLESDPEMEEMLKEEMRTLEEKEKNQVKTIENLLVPPDPRDSRSIILELRAGTGGDEAALFVLDCARMYRNYADQKKWKVEVLSSSESDLGGYKEYILSMSGHNVFRLMQYEGGTHRVQRIPATETQGRVHTSAITVAVLLEPSEEEKVSIEEKDLRIDTYRASGAGGQHVNRTDSAVRLTHLPTGIVVACQAERSQHKNKETAMRLLAAKILEEKKRKEALEMSAIRSSQIGSGDRSERIRTYNFPQNRVTDHRIDLTLYKLDRMMEGDLDELTYALVNYFYQKQLKE